MIILTIRTDNPTAELGLYRGDMQLAYITWLAHRQLSDTIHLKIDELLGQGNLSFKDLQGLVVFKGPGSFTGLRIGLSVANALAYSYSLPIVSETGEHWRVSGIEDLIVGSNERIARPLYGSPANTTKPR